MGFSSSADSEVLRGQRLNLSVRGPTFAGPATGAVPATSGVPVIAALATADAGHIRLLIINKSDRAPAVITVVGGSKAVRAVTVKELGDGKIFDPAHARGGLRWRDVAATSAGFPLRLSMPAHSMLWVDVE